MTTCEQCKNPIEDGSPDDMFTGDAEPLGDRPMTSAERKAKSDAARAAAGLVKRRKVVWEKATEDAK